MASNIPGILVSVWLNLGAAKLQYFERKTSLPTTENDGDDDEHQKVYILAPQERLLLRILALWIFLFVCVGWLGFRKQQQIEAIGVLVNINLLFFYGAPLQTMASVVREKNSESIHRGTMIMNWINTSFWVMYGFVARNDIVIYGPNAIGLVFGLIQGILCWIYPANMDLVDIDPSPLLQTEPAVTISETEATTENGAISEVI